MGEKAYTRCEIISALSQLFDVAQAKHRELMDIMEKIPALSDDCEYASIMRKDIKLLQYMGAIADAAKSIGIERYEL